MPFTIATRVSFEEEIKKSRFQAYATPVETEQDVKDFLALYKDTSTTHQCWAWKIGHHVRFNDDGEPSGTAGRPILATIEGNELTNVLVLVNRWYGGIKLGTGGLVRAYGGCAGQCLLLAEKIELIEKNRFLFHAYLMNGQSFNMKCNSKALSFRKTIQPKASPFWPSCRFIKSKPLLKNSGCDPWTRTTTHLR
jgi:uncharacterized YigZ family protein